jgi:hypothetical protein
MPKLTIYHTGGSVEIANLPNDDALDLIDEWHNGNEPVLTFTLDDNASTHIARQHIARIDVDH